MPTWHKVALSLSGSRKKVTGLDRAEMTAVVGGAWSRRSKNRGFEPCINYTSLHLLYSSTMAHCLRDTVALLVAGLFAVPRYPCFLLNSTPAF